MSQQQQPDKPASVWARCTLTAPMPSLRKGGLLRNGDQLTRNEVLAIGTDRVDLWVRRGILTEDDPNNPDSDDDGVACRVTRLPGTSNHSLGDLRAAPPGFTRGNDGVLRGAGSRLIP